MTSNRSPAPVVDEPRGTQVGNSEAAAPKNQYWVAQHSRPVIFLILTLGLLGAYLAFTIPVSVFPSTDFPRVLVAVDNGVMPIDQMMVTITRPLEEAVNSVPGLLNVRSITSRGSAEIDLYFRWDVDMFQTLQYVNAAISRIQPELPSTAKIEANRMTFAAFPIIAYSLTSDSTPQTRLWEMATYEMKPRLNRLEGVSTRSVADVSLFARGGEVVGLAGLVGSGKSEALRAAFGIEPLRAGRVFLKGKDVTGGRPRDREGRGVSGTDSRREAVGGQVLMAWRGRRHTPEAQATRPRTASEEPVRRRRNARFVAA